HRFLQGSRHCDGSGAALEISPAEHGRPAALYRADEFSAADTAADTVERQSDAGIVGLTLCRLPALRSAFDGLSERFLVVQSVCVANAVRVRRLVCAGRRPKDIGRPVFAGYALAGVCLSGGGVWRHADL